VTRMVLLKRRYSYARTHTDMSQIPFYFLKPKGASCAWRTAWASTNCPSELLYWRGGGGACRPGAYGSFAYCWVYSESNCSIMVNGGFIGSTKIGHDGTTFCNTSSNQYVAPSSNAGLTIDFWKALADGAWTSSTTINVYCIQFIYGSAGNVHIGPYPFNSYPYWNKYSGSLLASGNCGSGLSPSFTLTAYSDGTISV
jgi:hypothetical protein